MHQSVLVILVYSKDPMKMTNLITGSVSVEVESLRLNLRRDLDDHQRTAKSKQKLLSLKFFVVFRLLKNRPLQKSHVFRITVFDFNLNLILILERNF